MAARTQDEILARIAAVESEDVFGFAREVLIDGLDFEHAQQYLKPDATAEQWAEVPDAETAARGYLDFALGKILGHRGISAGRSVDKLREYAWLLGRDDVVAAMDSAGYQNYGAPKVKAFAGGMGWRFEGNEPSSTDGLNRMATGLPCYAGCEEGCGS